MLIYFFPLPSKKYSWEKVLFIVTFGAQENDRQTFIWGKNFHCALLGDEEAEAEATAAL